MNQTELQQALTQFAAERLALLEPLVPRVVSTHFAEHNFDVVRNPKVKVHLDDARHYLLTTNETYFFRDLAQLKHLRSAILPRLIEDAKASGRRRIRLWSAGCSTDPRSASERPTSRP